MDDMMENLITELEKFIEQQKNQVDKQLLETYYNGGLPYYMSNSVDNFDLGMSVGADEAMVEIIAQLQDIINNHKGE